MKIQPYLKLVGVSLVLGVCSLPVQATDKCLIGNWKADSSQLQKYFTQSTTQVFSNPSGNLSMSLKPNGSGHYKMNNLKLVSNSRNKNDPKVSMTMNGLYTFNWLAANSKISLNQHSNAIKTTGWVETAGMKIAIPTINHNQFGSTGLSSGAYSCNAKQLIFKMQGAQKMITVWFKQ